MEAKKYMYRVWYGNIVKYEVSRVTEKSVYFTTKQGYEVNERLTTNFYKWFETLEEAVTHI